MGVELAKDIDMDERLSETNDLKIWDVFVSTNYIYHITEDFFSTQKTIIINICHYKYFIYSLKS